jgi:putative ABC transport system substrate-binding protein
VFASVIDPVGQGLVQNLARPGGNITGFSSGISFLVAGKWLEMLRQITPPVARVAVLFNPETTPSADSFIGAVREAAQSIAVAVRTAPVHSISEIDGAMTAGLALDEPGGLVVLPSVFTVANRTAIIAAAAQHRLPAVYAFPFFARDGGLMSYGGDFADQQRRSAEYVDRILKGVGPGDLPVQQATKYVLVVNLKSAKALGITIAPPLLAIADEVIE